MHETQSTHVAPVHSLSESSSQRQSTVNLSLHAADPSQSSNSFLYKHGENASSTAVSGVFVSSSASISASFPEQDCVLSNTLAEVDSDKTSNSLCYSLAELTILQVNIRGWRTHQGELAAYIQVLPERPKFVAVNESFLNKAHTAKLPGYVLAGRRDRSILDDEASIDCLQSWGGVLFFVREDYNGCVVQVFESPTAERMWFVLHSDLGLVLLAVWYRPPCYGDTFSILSMDAELQTLREQAIGSIVIGDLNCHHSRGCIFQPT